MSVQETGPHVTCVDCGSDQASMNRRAGAYACPECGHRWADTTSAERACRMSTEGDTVTVEGVGEATVKYVAVDGEELGIRDDGGEMYSLSLREDGLMDVIPLETSEAVEEGVSVALAGDPWSASQ